MSAVLDTILDSLIDTLKLAPFLYITVFFMEYLEHRAGARLQSAIQKAGRFGPLLGAGLGLIPQCGFSAACAQFYNGGLISAGTLIAVFISTSDEAIPLLISHTGSIPVLVKLMLIKVAVGIISGYIIDLVWSLKRQKAYYMSLGRVHECEVEQGASFGEIALEALKRCLSILGFVLLFSLVTGLLIEWIGTDRLAALMLPGFFQPFICALIGFIPNCGASVLLTELYLDGMISFGACTAGLCTSAGVGLLILARGKHHARIYIIILSALYLTAVIAGTILQLIA